MGINGTGVSNTVAKNKGNGDGSFVSLTRTAGESDQNSIFNLMLKDTAKEKPENDRDNAGE